MTSPLSPDAGALGTAPSLRRVLRVRVTDLARHRGAILGYGQVLAGTGGRLVLQVVYFFVLANTLSLRDMGVFASVSAAGIMLGCFTGIGFQSFAFRSAAARPSWLGSQLAAFYACCGLSLPILAAVAGGLYVFVFRDTVGVPGYLAIIVVEIAVWRIVEMLIQVNNGLGRYGSAAAVVMVSSAFRAATAVAFWGLGGGDADRWAIFYLAGNAASLALLAALYHPRVRLRWRPVLIRGRFFDGLFYALSYFAFMAQNEVDKIVILLLAGERMAGIYAIAMRIVDLTAVPLRPLFVLYSRKLIQAGRATRRLFWDCLGIEMLVAVVSALGLGAVVVLIEVWPRLLGQNVATASGLLAVVVAVPAIRNLLEFHSELFFAFDRMGLRSIVAVAMVSLKAAALALLLRTEGGREGWGVWLNAVYAVPYVISFAVIYGLLSREARS